MPKMRKLRDNCTFKSTNKFFTNDSFISREVYTPTTEIWWHYNFETYTYSRDKYTVSIYILCAVSLIHTDY